MSEFRPARALGAAAGVTLTAVAVGLAYLLARPFLGGSLSLDSFGLLVAAVVVLTAGVVVGYWTVALLRLRYVLGASRLTIHWGGTTQVIPLAEIEQVDDPAAIGPISSFAGLRLPGCFVGRAQVKGLGEALAYGGRSRPEDLVYVVAASQAYLLSVADRTGFERALEAARARAVAGDPAGPSATRRADVSLLDAPLFRDPCAFELIGISLVLNLALFAYVTQAIPGLPELLPIRYAAPGQVNIVGLRTDLMRLPGIAQMVLASNAVLAVILSRRERLAALICLCAGLFVQLLFWVAVLQIVY